MLPLFVSLTPCAAPVTLFATRLASSRSPTRFTAQNGAKRVVLLSHHNRHSSSPEQLPERPPPASKRSALLTLRECFHNAMSQRTNLKANVVRNYGIAALIAYGFFDALTYSISFVISLRAYVAAGKVLTCKTLPQVLAIMWGINNFSRPFRVAGALALAPLVDRRVVKPIRNFVSRVRSTTTSPPKQDQ